jgi:hypothetical protein
MQRRKAIREAAIIVAAALTVGLARGGVAQASVFVSSMEKPTEVDTAHTGNSEQRSWTFGDSFDSNVADHAQSTQYTTDGTFSMRVHAPTGGFSWGTQYLVNNFNEAENPNETQGIAKFAEVAKTTKLMLDMTTPDGGPAYRASFIAINYVGGFLGSDSTSNPHVSHGRPTTFSELMLHAQEEQRR